MAMVRSLILSLLALTVSAQTWDTSGNSKLSGTWYFRNVVYLVGDSQGNLSRAIAAYGQITFSGSGTYSLSSKLLDSDSNSSRTSTRRGPMGSPPAATAGSAILSPPAISYSGWFRMASSSGVRPRPASTTCSLPPGSIIRRRPFPRCADPTRCPISICPASLPTRVTTPFGK